MARRRRASPALRIEPVTTIGCMFGRFAGDEVGEVCGLLERVGAVSDDDRRPGAAASRAATAIAAIASRSRFQLGPWNRSRTSTSAAVEPVTDSSSSRPFIATATPPSGCTLARDRATACANSSSVTSQAECDASDAVLQRRWA